MSKRPWGKRKKLGVKPSAPAPLPKVEGSGVRKIESRIEYGIDGSQLSDWRNEGWQVVHYQFVLISMGVPVLSVVMERMVDVVPSPVVRVEKKVEEPAVSPDTQKIEMPVVAILEPEPVSQPVPTLLEKLKEQLPILAAIDEYGVDAIKAAMDGEVYLAAQNGYNNAMQMMNLPITTTRFESRLLSAPTPNEDLVIEVKLS